MTEAANAPRKRERAIDLFKGLLVLGMVYCHTLQFFSDQQVYPNGQYWIEVINLITFSGFVFSFGYVSQLAYYSKTFRKAAPRMLMTALKTLAAFYVSGTAYRLFIDGRVLNWDNIRPILLLNDMPGWSEFLASFTYLMVLGLVLFVPLKRLAEIKWFAFAIAGALLLTTFVPYGDVHGMKWGPLLGTRDFASFPVLQYFPYYLLGILFARYRIVWDWRVLACAAAASAAFLWKWLSAEGQTLPERFPPSIWWIAGPALLLYGYYLLSRCMERYPAPFVPLEAMGRNVLWYLVMSNVLIFTLKGNQQNNVLLSAWDGFLMAVVLLAVVSFSIWIITKKR
ncbi:acyltransferase family protein [Paenibacillus kobensis]|uniref:acyltransferase family protein n=1 Tax=Paenibacillus kobensis TaxID=59841 RepID=UPI000FD9260B|nr:acyltransferase family protein [Paenibacillus kobensis]